MPLAIERIQRRPVLVGDEEVARAWINHEPFRIEAATERSLEAIQVERIEAVERLPGARQQAPGVGEHRDSVA